MQEKSGIKYSSGSQDNAEKYGALNGRTPWQQLNSPAVIGIINPITADSPNPIREATFGIAHPRRAAALNVTAVARQRSLRWRQQLGRQGPPARTDDARSDDARSDEINPPADDFERKSNSCDPDCVIINDTENSKAR